MIDYKKFFDFEEVVAQAKSYLKHFDEKRFRKAFAFAEEAHRGQMRKDGETPYIEHPVQAVKVLMSLHADEDTLITGLIHDVPEDTPKTIEEIEDAFGDKVAFLVDGVTKLSKVQYQQDMTQLAVDNLRKLFLHSAKDLRVLIVKLADRLHNMQTLKNIPEPEKRLRIATETLEVYVPIADLLGIREIKSQLEDLCFKHAFPTEYRELKDLLMSSKKRREKIFEVFVKEITKEAEREGIEIEVMSRTKNLYSVYKFLSAEGKTFENVDERIGVRIIVKNVSDCYRLLGTIHLRFQPLIRRFKDYIANPKSNGYQSLHTTVFGVEGNLAEVQIRTREMHIEAEYGIASHFFFNEEADFENIFVNDPKKSLWLKKVLDLEEMRGENQDFIRGLKSEVLQERIVVLSDKGLPIDLPTGATVVDFAYALDRDLAEHMIRAEIDGKLMPVTTILHTRDVVKVVAGKEKMVDIGWLSFARTQGARQAIIAYLKSSEPHSKVQRGMQILQRELDILNLGLIENMNFKKLSANLEDKLGANFGTMNKLLIALGEGEVETRDVVEALEIHGTKPREGKIKLDLKILARNRFGLSRDIYDVLYRNIVDMKFFKGWYSEQTKRAYFLTQVSVESLKDVSKLFQEIEQVDSVMAVYRTSRRALATFVSLAFLVGVVWVAHPLALTVVADSTFYLKNVAMMNTLLYLTLLLIFGLVLSTSNLVEKFFPEMRGRRIVPTMIFLVPVLAVGTLALEVFYFGLRVDWAIIGLEILFLYLYLGWNYRKYHKFKKKI